MCVGNTGEKMSTEILLREQRDVLDNVMAMEVRDEESNSQAAALLQRIASLVKRIKETLDPGIKSAREHLNLLRETSDNLTDPLTAAKVALGDKVAAYRMERRRQEEEAARVAQAKLQAAEEESRLRIAEELEKAGQKEAAAAVVAAPVSVPRVTIPAPAADGVSVATVWDFEIIDELAIPREYLMADVVKIGRMARAAKGEIKIPGVRVFSRTSTRVRTS